MYGYIYKITNVINGKIYIGAHVSSKFDPHYYGSSASLLSDVNDLKKYNFEVEVLKECSDLDELKKSEKEFIDKYVNESCDMYNKNMTNYGISHRNYSLENNPFYKGEFSKEILDHLSEVRKNLRWVNKNGIETTIPSEDVPDYLDHGWELGRLETSTNFHKDHSNEIWVTNGKSDHFINPKFLDEYISFGFRRGRSKGLNPLFSKGKSIFITNGIVNKRISPDDLSYYIDQGFYRGITRH